MKRDIITIDENKCNGCGECIPACPEGALKLVDGKVKLVNDLFCDGLGACIGDCPVGAIKIEQIDAEPYDEYKVMENIINGGNSLIQAHLKHLKDHGQQEYLDQAMEYLEQKNLFIPDLDTQTNRKKTSEEHVNAVSLLNNWPIQLMLMNQDAPYFKNADLLISADCAPFSYQDFQQRFLKDKTLIMFCPKFDENVDAYVEKLTYIFKTKNIQSITIVHMAVSCCSGIEIIVKRALENLQDSQKDIVLKNYTISIAGEIL